MTRLRLRRIFWIGAAAILVVAALIALAAVLRGRFSETDGRILITLAGSMLAGGTLVTGLSLLDRGTARPLARAVIGLAVPCFAVLTYSIWAWVDEGGGNSGRLGWSSVLVLIAALVAAGGRLLAVTPPIVRLAAGCAVLASTAATVSIAATWDNPGSTYGKAIAALWILTALALFLIPVLQRWSSVGETATKVRVLATVGDVELVATGSIGQGVDVGDPGLAPGEHLVLRRRPS